MEEKNLKFIDFLLNLESTEFAINTTASGNITIQQTVRNELRKAGVKALQEDLKTLYGDWFDVLETKEGIVFVINNDPGNFVLSWELKNTIKGLDYDPYVEAQIFADEEVSKAQKKAKRDAEKAEHLEKLAEKRATKMKALEARWSKMEQ